MADLTPADDTKVKYYSSLKQHGNKLHVIKGEELMPISFDILDKVDCHGVFYHTAIITDGDDIGYNYDIKECKYYMDDYMYHDFDKTETQIIQTWFGEGLYKKHKSELRLTNFDNGSLGVENIVTKRAGIKYAQADETLPSADR